MAVNPEGVWQIPPEDRKRLEEMGELYVRRAMQMTDGFPFPFRNSALAWLAELNETQRQMREALETKLTRQSESTVRAAWIVALAAIGAIVVGILTWLFRLH
jgi:hypothetical protein